MRAAGPWEARTDAGGSTQQGDYRRLRGPGNLQRRFGQKQWQEKRDSE